MSSIVKLKAAGTDLVPHLSVDRFQAQQALDDAKFKRDHAMLNLQVEFSRRRDKVTEDYLAEVAEISVT